MKIKDKFQLVISDTLVYRIESVCRRLKGSVTTTDVINWLRNFEEYEIDTALLVLEKVEYITENEIIELYDYRLKKILENNPNHIILHPVSEYGKSSTLMVYYFKKTPTYTQNETRITFYLHQTYFKHKLKNHKINSIIVFLDDFAGSGNQFTQYYKTFVEPQIKDNGYIKGKIFLTMFYLQKAATHIRKAYPEITIIGQSRNPAFLSKGSVFGYRKAMIPIRNFCYKYGEGLFSITDKVTGIEKHFPFGYLNSQALLVFAYNVPNNTLPIIWSNKNWIPLYSRIPSLKMSRAKEIRKNLAHEIGLLRNVDFASQFFSGEKDLGWRTYNFITKTDFVTFSLIRLIKQKRAVPVICQILGISEDDFNDYINTKPELFADSKTLTQDGNALFNQIKSQLIIAKKENLKKNVLIEMKNSSYLPKNFKGVT